jgi:signal transduction histidine kinase
MFFTSRNKFETEVAKRAMESCEHIASEMGAELHDDLIQKLSIFRLYLDRLERSVNDPVETELIVVHMRNDFDSVVQSVRKISRRLMPVSMDGDSFQARLNLLCQNMDRPGTGNVHFRNEGNEVVMPDMAQVYLHRIVQELIHNAFKHSAAWHVWVTMKWQQSLLVIDVEDDGTGFTKITDFIGELRKKHNTLRMRSTAIGALIHYSHGEKGLLANIEYPIPKHSDQ